MKIQEADTHLHTHENGTDEMHMHSHTQEHTHAHDTESAHGHHHHEHRGLKEITHMIEHSDMTENAKKTALRIFGILAEAEGKAHNVPADQVHFHEVGAVDSIVDIVSAAVCLDNLEITDVIVPVLHEGCGTVRCQHGILPEPVPAVVNVVNEKIISILKENTCLRRELVTPTGAAIAAAIKTKDQLPKRIRDPKAGVGAGKTSVRMSGQSQGNAYFIEYICLLYRNCIIIQTFVYFQVKIALYLLIKKKDINYNSINNKCRRSKEEMKGRKAIWDIVIITIRRKNWREMIETSGHCYGG